jgi:hypothetical protein
MDWHAQKQPHKCHWQEPIRALNPSDRQTQSAYCAHSLWWITAPLPTSAHKYWITASSISLVHLLGRVAIFMPLLVHTRNSKFTITCEYNRGADGGGGEVQSLCEYFLSYTYTVITFISVSAEHLQWTYQSFVEILEINSTVLHPEALWN